MAQPVLLQKIQATARYYLRKLQPPEPPVKGLPEGIVFDALDELCREQWGETLRDVSYWHLSGWKLTGTFRLLLRTSRRRRWTLIYRDTAYNDQHFPGLAEFPASLGPAEYALYSNARGTLAKYLPTVYRCSEVIPGQHYRYLLEDVAGEYERVADTKGILRAAAELPAIHRALREWASGMDQSRFLQYDSAFFAALQEYALKNLQRYAQQSGEESVHALCRLWPQISAMHAREELYASYPLHPIHGDFYPVNILIDPKHVGRTKLVDWEWMGLGAAHMDLASLLQDGPPELEEQALVVYAKALGQMSLEEHQRLYAWCKLERGIRDAAFAAAQQMGSPAGRGVDLRNGIAAGARMALCAAETLAQAGM